MEPSIPTSFIPKRPITSDAMTTRSKNRMVGALSVLTVVIVIATIVSFAGVIMYEKGLKTQKEKLDTSINQARDGLGKDFVTDMKRLNSRIDGVKQLLQTHIVVSPIFTALQSTTLRSVQFTDFKYGFVGEATTPNAAKSQMVKVDLAGSAKSYASIALQSDAFSENELIKNPVFSNLTVDEKTSRVAFKLTFTVNPADLSYQTFIAGLGKETGTPVSATSVINKPLTQ